MYYFYSRTDLMRPLAESELISWTYAIISGGISGYIIYKYKYRKWVISKSERVPISQIRNQLWLLLIVPIVVGITEFVIAFNSGAG